MRGFGYIKALSSGPAEFTDAVNGVKIVKNGVTLTSILINPVANDYFNSIQLLLRGTLPEINWNRIEKTTVSETSIDYLFSYNGNQQFSINVTNPYGDYILSITEFKNLISESGLSAIGLEDGSELLLEG